MNSKRVTVTLAQREIISGIGKTTCHPIKSTTHIYVKYTSIPPTVKC